MGGKSPISVKEILALVGFSTEFLPHPVALLTIEQAAYHAGVPKTTIDSAVEGSNQFRELVVCHAIEALATDPGEATWAALRDGLRLVSSQEALAGLLDARATELATDPSFALFLGGFDCLAKPRIARAVNITAEKIIRRFVPFIETLVGAPEGGPAVEVTPNHAAFIFHLLLTEAYRRLPGFPRSSPASEATITLQTASLILQELSDPFDTPWADWGAFFAVAGLADAPPEGRLAVAVSAGAELLVSGAIPLSMRLTVNDVTAATGMSVATFYRRFGSIAELEKALLECVGNEIFMCYQDEFFDGLLDGVRSGGLEAGDALLLFIEQGVAKVNEHIEDGRPDHQTIPWMQTDLVAGVFRSAYRESYDLRGAFYEEFTAMLGLSLASGLDGASVAAVLNVHSIICELLIRNAPDREMAWAVMRAGFSRVNAQLFT